nr:unnamed protein product [Digitaria exilis]
MAELAVGAVTSLLGLIRNEALLLGNLGSDVQFIKEEMESMNSFLKHLAKTALRGPSGEPDEQVQTWMKQVRELAHDCSNCIDLYLQRGNPAAHRYYLSGSLLQRIACWAPWMVDKLLAQHYAANQLRELRRRAHDVGQRRLRYGVEVPKQPTGIAAEEATTAVASSSTLSNKAAAEAPVAAAPPAAVHEDNEVEGDEDQSDGEGGPYDGYEAAKTAAVRRRALEPHSLDDYCAEKILEWLEGDAAMRESKIPSIAIVAPDPEVVGANARDALAFVASIHFKRSVWINLLKMHTQYLMEKRYTIARFWTTLLRLPRVVLTRNPPRPIDILCYILRECQEQNKQKKYHGEVQEHNVKNQAYKDRSSILGEISAKFQDEKMQKKVEEIVSKIKEVEASLAQESETDKSEDTTDGAMETTYDTHWTNKSLGILLQALNFLLIKPGETSRKSFGEGTDKILWDHDKIIKETAKKLKQHIEAVEPDLAKKDATDPEQKEKEEAKPVFPVSLDLFRYEHILHKMFPANEPQQAQEATTTSSPYGSRAAGADSSATATTSLGNAELKEIVHNIVYGILQDILKEQQQQFLQLPEATGKPAAKQEQATQHKPIHNEEDEYASAMKEAKQKIPQIKSEIKEQVTIQMFTSQSVNKDASQIFRDILDKCYPNEFCMKIFTHAIYANPNRSNEDLCKLLGSLDSQKSLGSINAKKMIKFSYNDLRKEYKACLLYLAIYPPGYPISRSTLVGRWVVEGLIAKEEWPNAVHHAERCFEALVNRWLVYPSDIGGVGKAKSCVVGDLVHEFITKIAKKQHIVEPRLSHHLARHFSIFNDVRLRGSDGIDNFLKKLRGSSEFSMLKVLDLEGTDITQLPSEINNLYELENGAAPELEKIVLSSTNIKSLCRVGGLPKLKELELKKNRFLLSITEEGGTDEKYTRSKLTFKKDEFQKLKYFLVEGPNMETDITFEDKAALELVKGNKSLLLSSLENAKKISKVILHSTWLDRGNLQILAKKPRIRCLVLSQNSYDESQLIFNNNDFPELNILIIECSTITNISFTNEAAPKLEKIVWSFSKMNSLSGITNLSKLKELEFTGDFVPDQVRDSIKTHPMQPFLTLKQPQHQDQGNGRVQEDDNDGKVSAACSWLLKNKYWPAAGQDEDLLAHILHPSIHP